MLRLFLVHASDYSCLVQEGYLWVLLDGGPSRAFSDSDVNLLEDDLRALQVFDVFSVAVATLDITVVQY